MPLNANPSNHVTSTTLTVPGVKPSGAERARKPSRSDVNTAHIKQDFDTLKSAFSAGDKLLHAQQITPDAVRKAYATYFQKSDERDYWPSLRKGSSDPGFDEKDYPSLFTELRLLGNPDKRDNWANLPVWEPRAVSQTVETVGQSALLRVLLAFVWKQGDWTKLKPLLAGLKGDVLPKRSTAGAVMWQFGKHLRDPLNQPIFDRHTSRAFLLLNRIAKCGDLTEFVGLFGEAADLVPVKDNKLNNRDRLDEYLKWWEEWVKPKLPGAPEEGKWEESDRAVAMLYWDRWMYSLGKAALGLHRAAAIVKSG